MHSWDFQTKYVQSKCLLSAIKYIKPNDPINIPYKVLRQVDGATFFMYPRILGTDKEN